MVKLRLSLRFIILAFLIAVNPITLFAQSRQFNIAVGDTVYYFGSSGDLTSEQRQKSQEEKHYFVKDIQTGIQKRMFNDNIEESMGRAHYFFISPDRKSIGIVTSHRGSYGESEDRLFIYEISSGSVSLLIDERSLIVYPVFSPDSQSIAFYSSDPRVVNWQWDEKERHKGCALRKVDVASKEIVELAPENYWLFRFTSPSWSPDGNRILFQAKFGEKGAHLYCLDIKNKTQTKIVPGDGSLSVDAMAWMSNDKILFSSTGAISERKPGIYQMNPDGSDVEFLISTTTVPNKIMEDLRKMHILFDDTDKVDRLLKARAIDLNGNDLTDSMMRTGKIFEGHYWNHANPEENSSRISYYRGKGWSGKIMARDEKTGKTWEVYSSDKWDPLFPVISPDGGKLCFWQIEKRWFENQYDEQKLKDLNVENARLSVWDLETKKITVVIPSSITNTYSYISSPPSWSPDSREIIVSAGLMYKGERQGNLFIVDMDGNNLHPVFEKKKFASFPVWISKDSIAYKMGARNLRGDIVCLYNLLKKEEKEIYRGPYIHEEIRISNDRKKLVLDNKIEVDLASGEKMELIQKVVPGLSIKPEAGKAWEIDEKSLPKVTPGELKASGDGLTVSDLKNKLMWITDPNKAGIKYYKWEDAIEVCENLNYAGYDDWRLPSLKELRSLLDPVSYDDKLFHCDKNKIYWSSTPFENNDEMVWSVISETGDLHLTYKINMAYTMPVRSIK